MTEIVKKEPLWLTAVKSAETTFLSNCPDKDRFQREFVFACQSLRNNNFMQKCTPESIKSAIINIALTGATLNPIMAQAFLVPRNIKINNNKTLTCCLDFSYRGLIGLATDGGSIEDMDSTCVYAGEFFEMEQGLVPILKHIPTTEDGRGAIVGVYAIATFKTGHKKFIHLTKEDIEKIRKTSQAPNSPMWKDHYGEGARKSAIKKLYKMLPQTDRMSSAIHVLNEFEGLEVLESKVKDIEDRFELPVTTEEPSEGEPVLGVVLDNIEKATTIEKLNLIASSLHGLPSEIQLVALEAIDYKRSQLKESENG